MQITINNKKIEAKEGMTIGKVARKNGIYIPHLCSHPELTPYGGCRLCIVEVDNIRGYPTACTTQISEGMVVRTETKVLTEMRREILQLILSEHPAGCLICNESEDCSDYQVTIRKVGVTTGCRTCPKDGDCELQKVVEAIGIEEITFPMYYRGLPVEKSDPFFDMDYNLCIYCSRCVRICEEHRKSSIITLKQRGRSTIVGPAFELSHVEAGCEFCGACVSVCPTGALSEKGRKWSGVPDHLAPSFCSFCSMNCDYQVLIKDNAIIGTLPPGNPHESGGDLCVKGRFCLSEWVHHPDRITVPILSSGGNREELSWSEAFAKASDMIGRVKGDRIAFFLSPDLSIEEIAGVEKFAKEVVKTNHITSSVATPEVYDFLSLASKPYSMKDIGRSDCIISVLLNGNYNYAPLTLAVKRAAEAGAPYYQIGWIRDTTSRFASDFLTPTPNKEKSYFRKIADALEKGKGGSKEIKKMIKALTDAASPVLIIGPDILNLDDGLDILKSMGRIAKSVKAKVITPFPAGNVRSLFSLAALKWNREVSDLMNDGKIDLLYTVGDLPFKERPPVKSIISHNTFFPSDEYTPDLLLPTATWGETSGSYAGVNGKRKKYSAAVKPPEGVLQVRETLSGISKSMGVKVSFSKREITKDLPGTWTIKKPKAYRFAPSRKRQPSPDSSFTHTLVVENNPHTFFGTSLSDIVGGMKTLVPENTLIVNPKDARKSGLLNGKEVEIISANHKGAYPVKIDKRMVPGYFYLVTSSNTFTHEKNPCPVKIGGKNV